MTPSTNAKQLQRIQKSDWLPPPNRSAPMRNPSHRPAGFGPTSVSAQRYVGGRSASSSAQSSQPITLAASCTSRVQPKMHRKGFGPVKVAWCW